MKKTFKNYIFSRQIILVSAVFLICFVFTTYLHTSLAKKEALVQAQAISNQLFSSMYQVMKKGWSRDDVMLFTSSLDDNFQGSNYEINIYRADKVKAIYGEIKEKEKDITLVDVLNGKIEKFDNFKDNIVRNILPLIEVKQNLNSIFEETKYQFIAFFLVIIPIFYILAFISSRYTTKKITD